MAEKLVIAKGGAHCSLLPAYGQSPRTDRRGDRHGKDRNLRVMAENFSRIGVPVFMADVKGDLSGIARPGQQNPKISERVAKLGIDDFQFAGLPDRFLGSLRRPGPPGAHDDLRNGAAVDGALAQS